jgi:hypothetical protein
MAPDRAKTDGSLGAKIDSFAMVGAFQHRLLPQSRHACESRIRRQAGDRQLDEPPAMGDPAYMVHIGRDGGVPRGLEIRGQAATGS